MQSHRHRRYRRRPSALPLIVVAGAAWLVWSAVCASGAASRAEAADPDVPDRDPQPVPGSGPTPAPRPSDYVRAAGPAEMRDRPRRWSRLDEELDESFPASDPPGNY